MPDGPRFVADTNILISRVVFLNSVPAQSVRRAAAVGDLLVSTETLEELESVLFRPKFDNHISLSKRLAFYESLRHTAEFIESVAPISACRDPKDDKFLALALTGHADFILTGDDDCSYCIPFAESTSSTHANTSTGKSHKPAAAGPYGTAHRSKSSPNDITSPGFRHLAVGHPLA
jgi:putative PIN family toxin of toxin-antitoxin system